MRTWVIILFLLFATPSSALMIQTADGKIEVNNGDTVGGGEGTIIYKGKTITAHKYISFWSGTIEGLEDVTFVQWNFARPTWHTEVFINCKNLTFINCNTSNVNLPEDSTIQGGVHGHQNEYEELGINYRKVETIYGKTHKFRLNSISETLLETKDTPNDKKTSVNIITDR